VWARVFAAVYDPLLAVSERAGMRRRRQQLLQGARGRTVEIGSGTGLNLPHYPADLEELHLAEPEEAMRERLELRLERIGRSARVLDATAERLPFEDASVDTVVSTLVLCTVDAPDLALKEITRVLRPTGQLLFIEHVRSDSLTVAHWQDRLEAPWRHLAGGCRCNRATAEVMTGCGFELELTDATWRAMPPIVRPLIVGRAVAAGSC
jgi:ubiquinone/menaquinone biosynthesis C-methylase UbiE